MARRMSWWENIQAGNKRNRRIILFDKGEIRPYFYISSNNCTNGFKSFQIPWLKFRNWCCKIVRLNILSVYQIYPDPTNFEWLQFHLFRYISHRNYAVCQNTKILTYVNI